MTPVSCLTCTTGLTLAAATVPAACVQATESSCFISNNVFDAGTNACLPCFFLADYRQRPADCAGGARVRYLEWQVEATIRADESILVKVIMVAGQTGFAGTSIKMIEKDGWLHRWTVSMNTSGLIV